MRRDIKKAGNHRIKSINGSLMQVYIMEEKIGDLSKYENWVSSNNH